MKNMNNRYGMKEEIVLTTRGQEVGKVMVTKTGKVNLEDTKERKNGLVRLGVYVKALIELLVGLGMSKEERKEIQKYSMRKLRSQARKVKQAMQETEEERRVIGKIYYVNKLGKERLVIEEEMEDMERIDVVLEAIMIEAMKEYGEEVEEGIERMCGYIEAGCEEKEREREVRKMHEKEGYRYPKLAVLEVWDNRTQGYVRAY